MTFKAINNLVDFDGLVPTLLVFSIYLQMTEHDALSLSIIQSVIAIQKIMNKLRNLLHLNRLMTY